MNNTIKQSLLASPTALVSTAINIAISKVLVFCQCFNLRFLLYTRNQEVILKPSNIKKISWPSEKQDFPDKINYIPVPEVSREYRSATIVLPFAVQYPTESLNGTSSATWFQNRNSVSVQNSEVLSTSKLYPLELTIFHYRLRFSISEVSDPTQIL